MIILFDSSWNYLSNHLKLLTIHQVLSSALSDHIAELVARSNAVVLIE